MTITEFLEENSLDVNDLIVYKKILCLLKDSDYTLKFIIKERELDKRTEMLINLFKDYDLKIVNTTNYTI